MLSLHPLPHTTHLTAPQEIRRPERRHHYEQANLFSTSPTPLWPQGQRILWGRRACHRQGHLQGQEEGLHTKKGCVALTVGEGEKTTSQHTISNGELCPGEEMEVKHFQVAQPRVLPRQEVLLQVVFCWVGRWVKTEAKYWKSIPTSHPYSWTQPPSHLKLFVNN